MSNEDSTNPGTSAEGSGSHKPESTGDRTPEPKIPDDAPKPRPVSSPSDFEAETFIGPASGASSGGGSTQPPPSQGHRSQPPRQTTVPASAPPGTPGAWSSTGSTLVDGHRHGSPGGAISDSWDQSANAPTMPPGGGSGFGSGATLDRGTIGPYPLDREVGRGGMGVVYLGRDEKLGRPVAIKVLPDMFAQHPERLARFEREARLLASLNHANIASIYELGEDEGARYLVLEYVPGQTLSERLQPGALPVDEALHICAQIAEGLEAAHEKGVIHRDLKPGNVKITPEGTVKVLDFGLAKASSPDSATGEFGETPTAIGDTQEGMILGTAGYMSPEQARGRQLDKRTDVWSFGCVLYECLTGNTPFYGETVSDTIALILRTDPDWNQLPPDLPIRVRELLQRCFSKDPKRRLRDIGEARIELQQAHDALAHFGATPGLASSSMDSDASGQASQISARKQEAPTTLWQYVPWAMAGLSVAVAAALLAALIMNDQLNPAGARGTGASVVRFSSPLPGGVLADARGTAPRIAVDDGAQWVVIAGERDGRERLFARSLDREGFEAVSGIIGASGPFFSADGEQIGLLQPRSIARIPTEALRSRQPASPTTIVDSVAGDLAGATWTDDGVVVFAVASGSSKGLYRADATSTTSRGELILAPGPREEFVAPRAVRGRPDLLIYTVRTPGSASVHWLSLNDPEGTGGELISRGHSAQLIGRGSSRVITYMREDALQAQRVRINGTTINTVGGVQSLGESISTDAQLAHYAVSAGGVLTFLPRGGSTRDIETLALGSAPISDTARDSLERMNDITGVFRIDPGNPERIAYITNDPAAPVRVIDGQDAINLPAIRGRVTSLAWRPTRSGPSNLTMTTFEDGQSFVRQWDAATGRVTELDDSSGLADPRLHAWTPDGRRLFLSAEAPETGRDIFEINEFTRVAITGETGDESDASVSPDGTLMAYTSEQDGVVSVTVEPLSDSRQSFTLTGAASWAPLWVAPSAEQAEGTQTLIVMRPDGVHRVTFDADARPHFGPSELLLAMPSAAGSERFYDASPDGSWLAMSVPDRSGKTEMRVVINFDDEIAQQLGSAP